ncbi:MAG: hypothetical protein ACRCZW_13385, partial [Lactobacillaceae bacterium]
PNEANIMIANHAGDLNSSDLFCPFYLEHFSQEFDGPEGSILALTNIYSRFSKVQFCHGITGKTIIEFLELWIVEFGKLSTFISDDGKAYASDMLYTFSPYTPSSNGISESIKKNIIC